VEEQIPDFLEILKVLSRHKVDFIIVGGVCAVLHGAPVSTFDLDLDALIRIKKETITDKDKATIPILERTLEEKARKTL
jgi:hypothetical protein